LKHDKQNMLADRQEFALGVGDLRRIAVAFVRWLQEQYDG
jgi:hypothetical protein